MNSSMEKQRKSKSKKDAGVSLRHSYHRNKKKKTQKKPNHHSSWPQWNHKRFGRPIPIHLTGFWVPCKYWARSPDTRFVYAIQAMIMTIQCIQCNMKSYLTNGISTACLRNQQSWKARKLIAERSIEHMHRRITIDAKLAYPTSPFRLTMKPVHAKSPMASTTPSKKLTLCTFHMFLMADTIVPTSKADRTKISVAMSTLATGTDRLRSSLVMSHAKALTLSAS